MEACNNRGRLGCPKPSNTVSIRKRFLVIEPSQSGIPQSIASRSPAGRAQKQFALRDSILAGVVHHLMSEKYVKGK